MSDRTERSRFFLSGPAGAFAANPQKPEESKPAASSPILEKLRKKLNPVTFTARATREAVEPCRTAMRQQEAQFTELLLSKGAHKTADNGVHFTEAQFQFLMDAILSLQELALIALSIADTFEWTTALLAGCYQAAMKGEASWADLEAFRAEMYQQMEDFCAKDDTHDEQ